MGFRELKQKGRADIHARMKVPAFYYPPKTFDVFAEITVRVHTKLNKEQGDLKGTSFSYAELEEHIPALLFWLPDVEAAGVTLTNNAVVMISATEGYRVDHFRQPDGPSQIGEVKQLTALELSRYNYPGQV